VKVLTAAQMREVDRRAIEAGIPGLILMENAGHRVVELLASRFAPLERQRIVVVCGKGNNGGDGFVVARQLHAVARPGTLDVVFAGRPEELKGEAAENYRMLAACGCPVAEAITPRMREATVVVDALLGTGVQGAPRGRAADLIREMNTGFRLARVVAVDIPSGVASDSATSAGEAVRAHCTVTFTAPKVGLVLPPNCDRAGELHVAPIGVPAEIIEQDGSIWLSLAEREEFGPLFAPRAAGAHKGSFGHVLVLGGSRGKSGAAAMAGMAALRAGAGLCTVASAESAIALIASYAAELMTAPLQETENGSIATACLEDGSLDAAVRSANVLAAGPGLGTHPETVAFVRRLVDGTDRPMVLDADALNALAGAAFRGRAELVLTPHPGEMARLAGASVEEIQRDRVAAARSYAMERGVTLVLKGQRTLVAFADGRVSVNPTGTPALATGGSGDILAGMIAGLVAQFPAQAESAVRAAVWLHGRAGELGAAEMGEKALVATDLLRYLPRAMEECGANRDG